MDDTRQSSEPGSDPAESTPSLGLSPRETEQASLRSLRDHVAKAVEEIVRLRAQNKSLVRRLAESEASGGISTGVFDEGTDIHELKAKISSFITSIDSYLAETDDV
ncbi:MAG: hypothetical protein WBW88_10825 [Rhodothermales bacterium]